MSLKIPSVPSQNPSDCSGYNLETDEKRLFSYHAMLEQTDQLNQDGSVISYDNWLKSSFFLPFKTSFEIDQFKGVASERISQNPACSSKYQLYLKFREPTSYVIRVTAVYTVHRQIQFNANRNCFKSHELEQ